MSTESEQVKQSQSMHSNVTIRTKYSIGRCLTQYTYAPPWPQPYWELAYSTYEAKCYTQLKLHVATCIRSVPPN